MQGRILITALVLVGAALAVFQYGCGKGCDASNCSGCCDSSGKCEAPNDATCGINGAACLACSGNTSQCDTLTGLCVKSSGGGSASASAGNNASGSGSGSTVGGSNTVGGSSTAGNGSTSATHGSTGTSSTTSTTSATTTGSTGSTSCGGGRACSYDNDCGGSDSCFNGCCVATGDTCNHGSAAYGPCAPGWSPDPNNDCCAPGDGGTSGGSSGGTSGTSGGFVCSFDGGISGGVCNPDCPSGFHCLGGECVLNGGGGPIQVTLRFDTFTDLDLHVIEPGGCEVYYGNRTCVGSLDLDANAGCGASSIDAENVIYPPLDAGPPPSGTYTVRVDDWSNCSSLASIPYEVIVRHNGTTDTYCYGFGTPGGTTPAPADNGGADAGTTIATFTYP